MNLVTKGKNPAGVLTYFEELSAIPRGSKNEEAAAIYVEQFGKSLGLETLRDSIQNVVIKKPATKGFESAAPIMLQGHLDMVCEKNSDTEHDFEKDPIRLILEADGNTLRADGTTLGADNGTAVAIMMDILARNDLQHAALECVFTSQEEIGLYGAFALDYSHLKSTRLINMDCGPEGVVLVSAAGGLELHFNRRVRFETPAQGVAISLKVRGLEGGHSGGCIHMERANSIKLLGESLYQVQKQCKLALCSVGGGLKMNAIPREAQAVFVVDSQHQALAISALTQAQAAAQARFASSDKNITFKIEVCPLPQQQMSEQDTDCVIALLCGMRNGVYSNSVDIPGLVLTSNNLGVLTQQEDLVQLVTFIRSADTNAQNALCDELAVQCKFFGFELDEKDGFPAWDYESSSPLRQACVGLYERKYGKQMKVDAVHGGLECGVIKSNLKDIDIIALGCNADGAHTPEERVYLDSLERFYEFVCELIKEVSL